MLPQQARGQNVQSSGAPPFPQSNEPSFNLDSSIAAKQMAALNVVNMQRQLANAYPRPPAASPSQIPLGGTAPASFLGGMPSPFNQSNALQPSMLDVSPTMQFPPNSGLQVQPAFPAAHGPQPNHVSIEPSVPSSNVPARHPPSVATLEQKQRSFLLGLAQVHLNKGNPLPPALTGVACPTYDPASSPWKTLECSTEIGAFRLAGKDVDLFKLWGIVFRLGGGHKVSQQSAWPQLLPQFDLPDYVPAPLSNTQRATFAVLAQHYQNIILPFEEAYRRNIQDQNRKAMMASGRPPGGQAVPNNPPNIPPQALPASSHLPGPSNSTMGLSNQLVSGGQNASVSITGSPTTSASQALPQSPHHQPGVPNPSLAGTHGVSDSLSGRSLAPPLSNTATGPLPGSAGNEHHEQDTSGMKRRLESEELDGKRVKLKLGGTEAPNVLPTTSTSADRSLPQNQAATVPPTSSRSRSQFMRTKIEYIPLAREVDTYGGRNLGVLEDEYNRAQRRPMRDINEWGTVDIEALTMSIRCRLTVELSYALTTLTLLSTMKGPTPGSGFPIAQCNELLEEMLDLLEDEAFDGVTDTPQYCLTEDTRIPRHRELVTLTLETELLPFAGLKKEQSSLEADHGPRHRSSQIILAITNIIRNLSVIPDNVQFMARHDRTLELLLRVGGVMIPLEGGPPRPTSPALTILDAINVRKDVLNILCNLSVMITFPQSTPPSESTVRICSRMFEHVASVLVEPTDAISPTQMLKLSGIPFHNCKPPSLSDMALDVFTHLAHLDHNRKVISAVIPQQWLWRLLETLVYRLPVSDADFAFLSRESWLSYLEKATMAIYAIAFLSPPELKKRIKSDRSLHFSQIMLRVAQRFSTTNASPEARQWFLSTARRVVEAMKAIDGGEDAFDTSQNTQPTLAFGMGFGESGETNVEKGMGMLAGRRDAAWDLLMHRDLDPTMFAELESLMRVD